MTLALTLLYRVVRRRVNQGEILEAVLDSYPRLTEDQRQELRAALEKASA